jgi:hypothetical protein
MKQRITDLVIYLYAWIALMCLFCASKSTEALGLIKYHFKCNLMLMWIHEKGALALYYNRPNAMETFALGLVYPVYYQATMHPVQVLFCSQKVNQEF